MDEALIRDALLKSRATLEARGEHKLVDYIDFVMYSGATVKDTEALGRIMPVDTPKKTRKRMVRGPILGSEKPKAYTVKLPAEVARRFDAMAAAKYESPAATMRRFVCEYVAKMTPPEGR